MVGWQLVLIYMRTPPTTIFYNPVDKPPTWKLTLGPHIMGACLLTWMRPTFFQANGVKVYVAAACD